MNSKKLALTFGIAAGTLNFGLIIIALKLQWGDNPGQWIALIMNIIIACIYFKKLRQTWLGKETSILKYGTYSVIPVIYSWIIAIIITLAILSAQSFKGSSHGYDSLIELVISAIPITIGSAFVIGIMVGTFFYFYNKKYTIR